MNKHQMEYVEETGCFLCPVCGREVRVGDGVPEVVEAGDWSVAHTGFRAPPQDDFEISVDVSVVVPEHELKDLINDLDFDWE